MKSRIFVTSGELNEFALFGELWLYMAVIRHERRNAMRNTGISMVTVAASIVVAIALAIVVAIKLLMILLFLMMI